MRSPEVRTRPSRFRALDHRPRLRSTGQDFVDTISSLHLGAAGWPAELDLACRWYRRICRTATRMHQPAKRI